MLLSIIYLAGHAIEADFAGKHSAELTRGPPGLGRLDWADPRGARRPDPTTAHNLTSALVDLSGILRCHRHPSTRPLHNLWANWKLVGDGAVSERRCCFRLYRCPRFGGRQ